MADLRIAYQSNISVIREYLRRELGCQVVDEYQDFARDGVILSSGPNAPLQFRLFVSHEFFSDFGLKETLSKLKSFHVAEQVREMPKNVMLFITTEGTFTEQIEGPTMRRASDVFESVIPSSAARTALYGRVFSIRVDGRPLGEIPTVMRGDPRLYGSYAEDFAKIVGAVYLLDAAGLRAFELHRRSQSEPPDFEVRLNTGENIYLAFERALNPAEHLADLMREEINAGLQRARVFDEVFKAAIEGHFVQVNLPVVPSDRRQCDSIVLEISRFITTVDWSTFPERSLETFDRSTFPLLSSLDAHVYVTRGVTSVSVREGAKSFDPYEPYRLAAKIVLGKAEALRAVQVSPLWLGISLADALVFSPESMDPQRLMPIDIDSTPFDRIIVGSAEKATVYERRRSDQEEPTAR